MDHPHLDWLFVGIMVVLTVALGAAIVRRPVRFSIDELRFAVVGPAVLGVLLVVAAFTLGSSLPAKGVLTRDRLALLGAACLLAGAGAYALAWFLARLGRGPLAAPRPVEPDRPRPSPPPDGWLRPGWLAGLPWLLAIACLFVVPLAVYVASYIPWVALGNQWFAGYPAGHTGQTFLDLQISMYDYHNNLRATHPASSPWWAWPLDLKPVWFYQRGFADQTTGVIYDTGNLVIFWLGIPAMAFAAWAAWHRRSLSLTLIVLMFAAMWLPWSRIDRATFQYHVYSSLPFAVLALAYFVAELWHGPPRGAWLLARVGAAVAIIGPALLWLVRQPLCSLAVASTANPNSITCGTGTITRTTGVSEAAFVSAVVLIVGASIAVFQVWAASRTAGGARFSLPGGRDVVVSPVVGLLATLAVTLLAILVVVRIFSPKPVFTLSVSADELALIALILLAPPAWLVLRARDSKRFALGILGAAVVWFVAWYPNLSGLPMPDAIANIYQGLLPTWNYDFQFGINPDPASSGPLIDGATVVVLVATLAVVVVAMVVARNWHTERSIEEPSSTLAESA